MSTYVDLFNETSFTGQNIVADYLTVTNDVTLSGMPSSAILATTAAKNITGLTLTDGQLLIGRTGTTPLPATLSGTSNQILIVSTSGVITLSTPQDIGITSSPTFTKITVGASGGLVFGSGTNMMTISGAAATPRTYTIPDIGSSGAVFIMSAGAQTLGGIKQFSSAPVYPHLHPKDYLDSIQGRPSLHIRCRMVSC